MSQDIGPPASPSESPCVVLRSIGPDPIELSWDELMISVRDIAPGTKGPRAVLAALILEVATVITLGGKHEIFPEEVAAAHQRIKAGEDVAAVLAEVVPRLIQQLDDVWHEADSAQAGAGV